MKIIGTFTHKKWDEQPYNEIENRMKASKVSVEFEFAGDFIGEAKIEYLMFYKSFDQTDPHKAVAEYVGLVQLKGKLKGKTGSFAMIDNGKFEAGNAKSNLSIINNSGTGELAKISGTGCYRANQSDCSWELNINV